MDASPTAARIAPRRTLLGATLTLAGLALLGGCASDASDDTTAEGAGAGVTTEVREAEQPAAEADTLAFWAPSTAPRWVRINREASFVLVEAPGDLIVVRTDKVRRSADGRSAEPVSRVTWMFSIPSDAAEGDRFAFIGASEEGNDDQSDGDGPTPPQGWALERGNQPGRAIPVAGFVTVLSRNERRMTLDLKVFPIDEPGVPDLLDRVSCELVQRPQPVPTEPPDTRSGVALAPRPPKDPPRRPTDAVWPWGELFGDYPPPKYFTE